MVEKIKRREELSMGFVSIKPEEIGGNPFSMLAREWMLVTAGDKSGYNMMTASWGGFGVMWNKNVAVTVIRPQRYTYEFMERAQLFTLSFYGSQRELHKICGSKSGRDINKTEAAGLTPVFDRDAVYFDSARLVLLCRKLYASDVEPGKFIDKDPLSLYDGDFHRMYVGEILDVLVQDTQ
jgi:flavin reductase (DIM6/NTAB) family NADH-FMN oxidoreductase RutF